MAPSIFEEPGQWRPFLREGAGWMQARQSIAGQIGELDSAVFRLGAGIEFSQSIETAWRMDTQYMVPEGEADDFQLAALLITMEIF